VTRGDDFANREFHKTWETVTGPVMCDFRVDDDPGFSRLDPVDWSNISAVLDAGCGPGAYVPHVRERLGPRGLYVAADISFERVTHIEMAAPVCADVVALPFADGSFDAVMAMHMLYHVGDIPAGLRELRRVLRNDGTLLVSTNSVTSEREFMDLLMACGLRELPVQDARFSSENGGDLLSLAFTDVRFFEERSKFVVPSPDPVVNTVRSMRYSLEAHLPPSLKWEDFVSRVAKAVEDMVDRQGAFVTHSLSGVFACK
jgi:SAM-dependent methyltransferase